MFINFSYFKETGKWYADHTVRCPVHPEHALPWIREQFDNGVFPGLVCKWDGYAVVTVNDVPRLYVCGNVRSDGA